jgi:hypothetical protein
MFSSIAFIVDGNKEQLVAQSADLEAPMEQDERSSTAA